MSNQSEKETEVIDISKADFSKDYPAWIILHAISDFIEANPEYAPMDKYPFRTDKLEIEFRVNGLRLPFVSVIRYLASQNEEMIADKAKELLDKHFCSMQDTLYKAQFELRNLLAPKLAELGANVEDWF